MPDSTKVERFVGLLDDRYDQRMILQRSDEWIFDRRAELPRETQLRSRCQRLVTKEDDQVFEQRSREIDERNPGLSDEELYRRTLEELARE